MLQGGLIFSSYSTGMTVVEQLGEKIEAHVSVGRPRQEEEERYPQQV